MGVGAPTAPVAEEPARAGSSDKFSSRPAGSGSLTVSLVAVPGPLLVTVMSNPMLVPALTGPTGLAVLVMWMLGHCTVTVATGELTKALLEATAVALLLTVAQSADVVCELTWISWLVPGPMSPRVQVTGSAV